MDSYDYNTLNDVYQNEIFPRKVADVYKLLGEVSQKIWQVSNVLKGEESTNFHLDANEQQEIIANLEKEVATNNQKIIELAQKNNKESNAQIKSFQERNSSLYTQIEQHQKSNNFFTSNASNIDEEKSLQQQHQFRE